MPTVRDLINSSHRLLGVIATGETLPNNEMTDALSNLNGMLSGWANSRLFIKEKKREEFDLVSGQASYTMGPSGNFNSARPVKIEQAAYLNAGAEYPIEIIDQVKWSNIPMKQLPGIPKELFTTGTTPLETIILYPVPNESQKIVIYSLKSLSKFTSLDQVVEWPDGYERAVRFNFAIEQAPEYSKQISAEVMKIADESKADIKRINLTTPLMDSGLTAMRANIFRGR